MARGFCQVGAHLVQRTSGYLAKVDLKFCTVWRTKVFPFDFINLVPPAGHCLLHGWTCISGSWSGPLRRLRCLVFSPLVSPRLQLAEQSDHSDQSPMSSIIKKLFYKQKSSKKLKPGHMLCNLKITFKLPLQGTYGSQAVSLESKVSDPSRVSQEYPRGRLRRVGLHDLFLR